MEKNIQTETCICIAWALGCIGHLLLSWFLVDCRRESARTKLPKPCIPQGLGFKVV